MKLKFKILRGFLSPEESEHMLELETELAALKINLDNVKELIKETLNIQTITDSDITNLYNVDINLLYVFRDLAFKIYRLEIELGRDHETLF